MHAICQFFRNNYVLASCEEAITKKSFTLNLSHYEMSEVPTLIEKCETLLKLFLNQNVLKTIPDTIGNLMRLQVVSLDYNKLTEFPLCICRLTNLHFLNVSCNTITILPPEIGQLTMLETFWCNNTGLLELPNELCRCEKLETLGVRNNHIKELPSGIGELTRLRWLTLDANELTEVPLSLALLGNLVHLNLRSNRLTKVPRALMAMTKLQFVFLNDNCIDEIPKQALLEELHFLRMLNLCQNPICVLTELKEMAVQQTNLYIDQRSDIKLTEQFRGGGANVNADADDNQQAGDDNEDRSSSDWANSVKTSELNTTDDSDLENNIEDLSVILPELSRYITNF